MKELVRDLQDDIDDIERTGSVDHFTLAARYCDRFVTVHLFEDGNGSMCRLIINAILIKYVIVVIVLEEKKSDRDQHLEIASERTKVKGHPGQLRKVVLERARGSFRTLRNKLRGIKQSGN